jgi:hypothetical protein
MRRMMRTTNEVDCGCCFIRIEIKSLKTINRFREDSINKRVLSLEERNSLRNEVKSCKKEEEGKPYSFPSPQAWTTGLISRERRECILNKRSNSTYDLL